MPSSIKRLSGFSGLNAAAKPAGAVKGPAPKDVPGWLDWVMIGFAENFAAVFEELGSAPPSAAASRFLDAYGCFPGMSVSMADAISAYTQSFLKSEIVTWK